MHIFTNLSMAALLGAVGMIILLAVAINR
jgi:hypothetical protein